jgi:hypothetical protein
MITPNFLNLTHLLWSLSKGMATSSIAAQLHLCERILSGYEIVKQLQELPDETIVEKNYSL